MNELNLQPVTRIQVLQVGLIRPGWWMAICEVLSGEIPTAPNQGLYISEWTSSSYIGGKPVVYLDRPGSKGMSHPNIPQPKKIESITFHSQDDATRLSDGEVLVLAEVIEIIGPTMTDQEELEWEEQFAEYLRWREMNDNTPQ